MAAAAAKPKFAEGSDENLLTKAVDNLTSGKWALTANGQGLERPFKFKTFAKTWDFMTAVSLQCKIKNHHPEWSNVYNTTFIRWTTHSPPGLSAKDTELAAICDDIAKSFGEVQEETPADQSCQLKGLADKAASTSGDCCTPKK
ncbi:Putative pterin-4-alpha-carbinolamine dehydratase [Cytospora mali]|uniref:4a-hydroxytetrahydrobiopterin dehydratase n=1 Tax=Cytospora mali TaxID=578113 RepID=A0A194VY31_CYTMA|nr:Putative pterin-4-alpha-carbinolamine dehydratase [Valsa mali]